MFTAALFTIANIWKNLNVHQWMNGLRELFSRQVDRKSKGPQGERGLEYSRRKKGQTFYSFPLHSLGLYNNNVSCLRTVFELNPLANSVILKHKL